MSDNQDVAVIARAVDGKHYREEREKELQELRLRRLAVKLIREGFEKAFLELSQEDEATRIELLAQRSLELSRLREAGLTSARKGDLAHAASEADLQAEEEKIRIELLRLEALQRKAKEDYELKQKKEQEREDAQRKKKQEQEQQENRDMPIANHVALCTSKDSELSTQEEDRKDMIESEFITASSKTNKTDDNQNSLERQSAQLTLETDSMEVTSPVQVPFDSNNKDELESSEPSEQEEEGEKEALSSRMIVVDREGKEKEEISSETEHAMISRSSSSLASEVEDTQISPENTESIANNTSLIANSNTRDSESDDPIISMGIDEKMEEKGDAETSITAEENITTEVEITSMVESTDISTPEIIIKEDECSYPCVGFNDSITHETADAATTISSSKELKDDNELDAELTGADKNATQPMKPTADTCTEIITKESIIEKNEDSPISVNDDENSTSNNTGISAMSSVDQNTDIVCNEAECLDKLTSADSGLVLEEEKSLPVQPVEATEETSPIQTPTVAVSELTAKEDESAFIQCASDPSMELKDSFDKICEEHEFSAVISVTSDTSPSRINNSPLGISMAEKSQSSIPHYARFRTTSRVSYDRAYYLGSKEKADTNS